MRIAGTSRSAGRRGAKNLRAAGWRKSDRSTVRRRSVGPRRFGLALACGGLHIPRQEGVKDVVSEEGTSKKHSMRGVMLEDVIGVPLVDQLVEAIILDIPSLVAKWTARSTETWWAIASSPDPVTALGIVLLVELPAYRVVSRERITRTGAFT